VDRSHSARSLAHRGGDPLHRAVADVPGGEHPGDGRLEWKALGCAVAQRRRQLAVGENESVAVGYSVCSFRWVFSASLIAQPSRSMSCAAL
jgi:hypothetical protein